MNPDHRPTDPRSRAAAHAVVPLALDPPGSLPRPLSSVRAPGAAGLNVADLAHLHDAAHDRARALRAEAFEDFWRHADHLLAGAADRATRSARRLVARLDRHHDARHRATVGCAGAMDAAAPCRP